MSGNAPDHTKPFVGSKGHLGASPCLQPLNEIICVTVCCCYVCMFSCLYLSSELLCLHVCLFLFYWVAVSHPACKKTRGWGAGMVICLERGADLHIAKLMLLPLTVCCFSKIQIGFTFLVPAHLGSPGKRAVKRVLLLLLLLLWVSVLCVQV